MLLFDIICNCVVVCVFGYILFICHMTHSEQQVAKLQRASLYKPMKVEVSHKFSTPKTLVQQYLFIPAKYKDCYLTYVLNEFKGQTIIVFAATCNGNGITTYIHR